MNIGITAEQRSRFDDRGYFVTGQVFTADEMRRLDERISALEREHTEKIAAQGGAEGISRASEITFTTHLADQDREIREFVTRQEFVDIATQLLGPDIDLYWDQSVFKKPEGKKEFPWHQDDGYTPVEPSPYLTLWLALNDATPENGCISVLPGSHKRGLVEHVPSDIGLVCYGADEPDQGVLVPVSAGSMAVFSSLTFHKSGANLSNGTRKAYVIQYCRAGTRNKKTGELVTPTIPTARGGRPAES